MPPAVETVARVCHEANRALQHAFGEEKASPPWDEAPEWQRESAIYGVTQARQGATPEQLHESWCEMKRQGGWTHGTVKDDEALTHPCLITYDQLPDEQKVKDHVFSAIVGALSNEGAQA